MLRGLGKVRPKFGIHPVIRPVFYIRPPREAKTSRFLGGAQWYEIFGLSESGLSLKEGLIKSVTPAKAGVQFIEGTGDSGLRRNDE